MWNMEIRGVTVYHVLNWFFIYSFLGWVWESCYVSVKEKRWVNRGFVTGPLCTIYGFGALTVYLFLWPYEDHLLILFLGGMVLATVLEYITAWLMETIFHASWWDYSTQPLNLQGRICLGASLGWGVFTVILFRVFQPFVEKIVSLYPVFVGKIFVVCVMAVHAVDVIVSGAAAFGLREKLEHLDEAFDELTEYLMSTKFYEATEELKWKVQCIRENYSAADFYAKHSKRMEIRQAVLNDYLEQHGILEHKEEAKGKIAAFHKRLKEIYKENDFFRKRMLSAYPHLKSLPQKAKAVSLHRVIRKKK